MSFLNALRYAGSTDAKAKPSNETIEKKKVVLGLNTIVVDVKKMYIFKKSLFLSSPPPPLFFILFF